MRKSIRNSCSLLLISTFFVLSFQMPTKGNNDSILSDFKEAEEIYNALVKERSNAWKNPQLKNSNVIEEVVELDENLGIDVPESVDQLISAYLGEGTEELLYSNEGVSNNSGAYIVSDIFMLGLNKDESVFLSLNGYRHELVHEEFDVIAVSEDGEMLPLSWTTNDSTEMTDLWIKIELTKYKILSLQHCL